MFYTYTYTLLDTYICQENYNDHQNFKNVTFYKSMSNAILYSIIFIKLLQFTLPM